MFEFIQYVAPLLGDTASGGELASDTRFFHPGHDVESVLSAAGTAALWVFAGHYVSAWKGYPHRLFLWLSAFFGMVFVFPALFFPVRAGHVPLPKSRRKALIITGLWLLFFALFAVFQIFFPSLTRS